ncbi:hypothetical protein GCM10022394_07880 [Zobellella aerophila]|uniref:Uncharacterized protein n=1 Tax=Zobellella aerophila TaxID=870480 RepID=A0ABP6V8M8_9GAMM
MNTEDFQVVVQAGPHHGTNGRVHARGIATTGQYTNSLNHIGLKSCWTPTADIYPGWPSGYPGAKTGGSTGVSPADVIAPGL